MAAAPKKDQRAGWHAALDKVEAEATKAFPEWRGKIEQLHGHLLTVHMVIDDLHDLVPYEEPTS